MQNASGVGGLLAALLFLPALVPVMARAQSDAPGEAVEFYRQAREHYEAGQYREAATALERAVVLDPDSPTLVFNLARVYELLGELDRAVVQYERYQQLLPQQQAREQEQAEATLRRLRGAQSSEDFQPAPPPREVEPLRQLPGIVLVRENGVADAAFWATLAAGALGLAAGGVTGGFALAASAQTDGFVLGPDGGAAQREALHDQAVILGGLTDGLLAAGGIAVVIAGLLYFLREHTVERATVRTETEGEAGGEPEPEARLELGGDVGLGALRVTVGGRF